MGVGNNGDEETASVKRGRIWGGGRLLMSQAFSLILNPTQSARVAALVADRVNETFQAGFRGDPGTAVAVAKDALHHRPARAAAVSP